MEQSNNPIYKHHFSEVAFLDEMVEPTPWRGQESQNSFSFKGEGNKREILQKVFNINIPEEKYREAISGSGNKGNRITVLHSSSLAALLFFHSVSDINPIKIVLDDEEYTFTEVHFERKTVVSGSHKSNMDVVMYGNSGKGEKTVLFLECKFSEYLNSGKCSGISTDVYKQTYEQLGLFKDGTIAKMKANSTDDKNYFELNSCGNKYQYCKGIKQMISHYIGISNFIRSGYKSEDEDDFSLPFTPDRVLLAEVLFGFPNTIDSKNRLQEYKTAYKELAVAINNYNKNKVFHMVSKILTYGNIFSPDKFKLPKRIEEFYRLQEV